MDLKIKKHTVGSHISIPISMKTLFNNRQFNYSHGICANLDILVMEFF